MARIERLLTGDAASLPADLGYDEVRQSFLGRLRNERTHLVTLTRALESAASPAEFIFRELEGFSHRLRGAAAVFDFRELRDCAKELELAAGAAAFVSAPADEPRVKRATRELQERLMHLMGSAISSDLATLP
jgi:hypothetical protein